MKIKALPGKILVSEIQQGQRMVGRIILPNDDGTTTGVRPRWCKVYSFGDDVRGIKVGEWILVHHGDWTRKISIRDGDDVLDLWAIKPEGILASTDDPNSAQSFAAESIIKTEKLER